MKYNLTITNEEQQPGAVERRPVVSCEIDTDTPPAEIAIAVLSVIKGLTPQQPKRTRKRRSDAGQQRQPQLVACPQKLA